MTTPLGDAGGWLSVRKVAFFDPDYPDSLVREHGRVAVELERREGYMRLDAAGLRLWMSAQAGAGVAAGNTVCVLCHGIVPDTVAAEPSPDCLVRRYMEAGGLVLWIGDTPFVHQGVRGAAKYWGDAGHRAVLGLDPVLGASGEVEITRAGREWGLDYEVDNTSDCVSCRDATVVLSEAGVGLASSYLKNYNPRFPLSGFLRYRAAAFRGDFDRMLEDLVRLGRHALGEDLVEAASEPPEPAVPPEPEPPPAPAPPGELVETGSFRVDRSRALEKLSRFQLPEPEMFLLPWVRWAVAAGAKDIEVRRTSEGLLMSFDGATLGRRELEDPYRYVLEAGGERGALCRQLALGVLCALRLKPDLLRVVSGVGDSRTCLRLSSFADQTVEEARDGGTRTVITVRWDGFSAGPGRKPLSFLGTHCRACPVLIVADGELVPRDWETLLPERGVEFAEDGRRGWLGVPPEPLEASLLETYVHGVLVGATQFSLPLVQVRGFVADDALALNASQTGVVHDERFAALEHSLARQADRLLLETVERHRERMPETARRVLSGSFLAHWAERIERGASAERAANPLASRIGDALMPDDARAHIRLREEVVADIHWDARVAAWLRDSCRRRLLDLRQYELDADAPWLKALWDAPIYLGARGETLSWRQIECLRHGLRHIPFSREPAPALREETVVWRVCPRELKDLEIRFGEALLDVTARLAAGSAAPVEECVDLVERPGEGAAPGGSEEPPEVYKPPEDEEPASADPSAPAEPREGPEPIPPDAPSAEDPRAPAGTVDRAGPKADPRGPGGPADAGGPADPDAAWSDIIEDLVGPTDEEPH